MCLAGRNVPLNAPLCTMRDKDNAERCVLQAPGHAHSLTAWSCDKDNAERCVLQAEPVRQVGDEPGSDKDNAERCVLQGEEPAVDELADQV